MEHPDFPAKSKFTRVDQYFSEMVIKPHSYIDELGFDYELTYLDNPQISLPSSVVNWVTTTGKCCTCVHVAVFAPTYLDMPAQIVDSFDVGMGRV